MVRLPDMFHTGRAAQRHAALSVKSSGVTLIEMLVCLAICLVLAAIAFPVFTKVKAYAKQTSAASNLHQLYLAAEMYRMNYDGEGIYGSAIVMGFPGESPDGGLNSPADIFLDKNRSLIYSPCGLNRSWFPYMKGSADKPVSNLIFTWLDPKFGTYAGTYRQNTMIVEDVNCDDPGSPINNPYYMHRGLGVTVSGQLVNHYKTGQMLENPSWWTAPAG